MGLSDMYSNFFNWLRCNSFNSAHLIIQTKKNPDYEKCSTHPEPTQVFGVRNVPFRMFHAKQNEAWRSSGWHLVLVKESLTKRPQQILPSARKLKKRNLVKNILLLYNHSVNLHVNTSTYRPIFVQCTHNVYRCICICKNVLLLKYKSYVCVKSSLF